MEITIPMSKDVESAYKFTVCSLLSRFKTRSHGVKPGLCSRGQDEAFRLVYSLFDPFRRFVLL